MEKFRLEMENFKSLRLKTWKAKTLCGLMGSIGSFCLSFSSLKSNGAPTSRNYEYWKCNPGMLNWPD